MSFPVPASRPAPKPTVSLSRATTFSAGRRLFRSGWSEQHNREVFGLDARPHGHEYRLEAAYCGPISDDDGMILNVVDLKPVMERCVAPLREAWLEDDLAHDIGRPTAENLAQWLWRRLPARIERAHLYRLKLRQGRHVSVEIGASPPRSDITMKVSRSYEFAAAHRLFVPTLTESENSARFDRCANPAGHGHNYGLEVWVEGTPDPESGFIINPALLDVLVEQEVYARFDHKHLNVDCPEFAEADLVPTSENLASLIFELLGARLRREGYRLARVGLRETQKNYFEVEA